MADFVLPFEPVARPPGKIDVLFASGLFQLLPEEMQAACHRNPQLLEYLSILPIEQTGVPEYYKEMDRKLGRIKRRNLIYPVSDQIHIHVLSTGEERDHYIPIEPTIGVEIGNKAEVLKDRMVELAYLFEDAETPEDRREILHTIMLKLCRILDESKETPSGQESEAHPKGGLLGPPAVGKAACLFRSGDHEGIAHHVGLNVAQGAHGVGQNRQEIPWVVGVVHDVVGRFGGEDRYGAI